MKKCKKILLSMLSLMLVLSSFVPLSIDTANAESRTITRVHRGTISSNGNSFEQGTWQDNTTGADVFCIDPDAHQARAGSKNVENLAGYRGLGTDGVVRMALGVKYIDDNYSSIGATNLAMLKQVFVWDSMYKDSSLNGRVNWGVAGKSATEVAGIISSARAWADNNKAGYTATGLLYRDAPGFQNQVSFSVAKAGGNLKLIKTTASNKHLTDICPENYSLEGATYGVYTTRDLTTKVGDLVVDFKGISNVLVNIPAQTYYVKEIKAPKGYALNEEIYEITVVNGDTATLNVEDEPIFDPLRLVVEKRAAEGVDKNLSLEGAEYTVKYYKEGKEQINKDTVANFTPFRTWVFVTKALSNGKTGFMIKDEYKIGGDELFKDEENDVVSPIGTIIVEETKAPKGFAKTEGIISLQYIAEDEKTNGITLLKDVIDIEKPQTVSLTIEKKDSETGTNQPQGHGTLEGAKYEVSFWNVLENAFEKVATLVTNAEGKAIYENGKPGLYKVEEIEASRGYIVDSAVKEIKAGIKELNTANFNYDVESLEDVTKVEFSKTTIDENGKAIHLAGATIQLLDDTGAVIEEFVTTNDPKVIKGLTVGKTYTFREVSAPVGYFKAEDVSITIKDTKEVQKLSMFDEPVPDIKTTAYFEGGAKVSPARDKVVQYDKIAYEKLIPGKEYEAKTQLVLEEDETKVIAEGITKFIPETASGFVIVKLEYDASLLEGKTIVTFEDLYKDGKLVKSHREINDKEQTTKISKLGTKATFMDGSKEQFASSKMESKDVVSYENIKFDKKVDRALFKGTLYNKGTGKPYVDADGKEVTAELWKDLEDIGEAELHFTFNGLNIEKSTELVVFEEVFDEQGNLIAEHKDINDKGQTIKVKPIGTIVIEEPKGKHRTKTADDTMLGLMILGLIASAGSITALAKRK